MSIKRVSVRKVVQLDFLDVDGVAVLACYRVNKNERPFIRVDGVTIHKTKKVVK